MIAMLGPEDLLLVVAIVALLFGGKKLPELAHSLGRSKREFEKGLRESEKEEGGAAKEPPGGTPRTSDS